MPLGYSVASLEVKYNFYLPWLTRLSLFLHLLQFFFFRAKFIAQSCDNCMPGPFLLGEEHFGWCELFQWAPFKDSPGAFFCVNAPLAKIASELQDPITSKENLE